MWVFCVYKNLQVIDQQCLW
ncbi:hypothetical protein LINPERHAP1_LOCUS10544 [Linum perenne]